VGTRFRAPSSAAKIMNANPKIPKINPIVLPPRDAAGVRSAYAPYAKALTAKIDSEATAHPRCVLSILMSGISSRPYKPSTLTLCDS
jgi:hypothetical protein